MRDSKSPSLNNFSSPNTFINHLLTPVIMAVSVKYGSTKRFGARYGRRIKEKLGKVELIRKKKQMCPYCAKQAVVRKSYGIWNCRHCNAEFTGYAYSVSKKSSAEEKESQVLEVTKQPEKEQALVEEEQ